MKIPPKIWALLIAHWIVFAVFLFGMMQQKKDLQAEVETVKSYHTALMQCQEQVQAMPACVAPITEPSVVTKTVYKSDPKDAQATLELKAQIHGLEGQIEAYKSMVKELRGQIIINNNTVGNTHVTKDQLMAQYQIEHPKPVCIALPSETTITTGIRCNKEYNAWNSAKNEWVNSELAKQ